MHHSALLHDPVAVSTPSQLSAALAHKKRQERFARAAVPEVVKRVEIVPAPEPEAPKTGEELVAEWTERQKEKFKEPWFSIVEEVGPPPPQRPKIEAIQRATALHFGVSVDDMLSARRTADVVTPRHVAIYLSRMMTLRSMPEIGRKFGDRDHTSILSAVRKITRLVASDYRLANSVTDIQTAISGDVA